jgi:hypothetical protein
LADEFCDRLQRGDDPDIDELARRHPSMADVIRRTLEALTSVRAMSLVMSSAAIEHISASLLKVSAQ